MALSGRLSLYREINNALRIEKLPMTTTYREALELSKEVLRRLSDYNDEIHVMFSGGRDSLVVLHLAVEIFNKVRCIYVVVTGNTHEKNIEYVYSITKELGVSLTVLKREDIEFYAQVIKWGWPGPRRKWCMTEFKRIPIERYFKLINYPVALVGTKRSDSGRRKLYVEKDGMLYISKWSTIVLRPIAHWSDEFVKRYIEENSLRTCDLYHELGESGNCVYCPFITSRDYYRKLYVRYPRWLRKIVYAELKVKKGKPFIFGRKKVSICEIIGIPLSELIKRLNLDCST